SASWQGLLALPDTVIVAVNVYTGDNPYTLIGVDSSGKERWRHGFASSDDYLVTSSAVVVIDKSGHQLIGYDPRSGDQKWSVPDIKDQYGYSTDGIYPVLSAAELAGPGDFDGLPTGPYGDRRIVELSGDLSARVIDTATGGVGKPRGNVGDPRQATVLAYADRLYVAPEPTKYQVLSYDLASLGTSKLVYPAADPNHRLKAISPCGDRVCLLDESGSDQKGAAVIAVDPGSASVKWQKPVP